MWTNLPYFGIVSGAKEAHIRGKASHINIQLSVVRLVGLGRDDSLFMSFHCPPHHIGMVNFS